MVKKIVVIAISFAFALTSFIVGKSASGGVEVGAGKGVSRSINSVEELAEVISKVPTFNDYLENSDLTSAEGFEDFKGVTVIETADRKDHSNYRYGIYLPTDEVCEGDPQYKSRTTSETIHRVEMSFAANAVYYHAVGSRGNGTYYYHDDYDENLRNNFYNDGLRYAERTREDYDVEVYHSNSKTMFKINAWTSVDERATYFDYSKNNYNWSAYVPTVEDDEENSFSKTFENEMLKIRDASFGKWIELDLNAEVDEDFENIEDMTEDQIINMYIDQIVATISYTQVQSIAQVNDNNKAYISKLSTYLAAHANDSEYFKKSGNNYDFISYKYVEPVRDSQTNEIIKEGYTDYTNITSYLKNVVGASFLNGSDQSTYLRSTFNVKSDLIMVNQSFEQSTKYNSMRINSNTSFMYVDNTVVNLKNAKTITVEEAYGTPIRNFFNSNMQQIEDMMGGN